MAAPFIRRQEPGEETLKPKTGIIFQGSRSLTNFLMTAISAAVEEKVYPARRMCIDR